MLDFNTMELSPENELFAQDTYDTYGNSPLEVMESPSHTPPQSPINPYLYSTPPPYSPPHSPLYMDQTQPYTDASYPAQFGLAPVGYDYSNLGTYGTSDVPSFPPSYAMGDAYSYGTVDASYGLAASSTPPVAPATSEVPLRTSGETVSLSDAVSKIKPSTPPPTKKRKLDELSQSASDISFVALTREQLLSVSSAELENLIEEITSVRPLTDDEEKEIKRHRRLIKNREYAQASRKKKKAYLHDLEKQVKALTDENKRIKVENQQLLHRVTYLESDNQTMRYRLSQFVVGNHRHDSTSGNVVAMQTGDLNFNAMQKIPVSHSNYSVPAMVTQGLCLFGLFMFAVFFAIDLSAENQFNAIVTTNGGSAQVFKESETLFNGNTRSLNGQEDTVNSGEAYLNTIGFIPTAFDNTVKPSIITIEDLIVDEMKDLSESIGDASDDVIHNTSIILAA